MSWPVRPALAVTAMAALGTLGLVATSLASATDSCANEQARAAEPFAPALPDCRAYEQISPVQKSYADALGAVTSVRASGSGEAVTFDSLGSFPLGAPGEGSPELFNGYLSARAGEAWLTQNLEPAVQPGGLGEVLGVSEDLAYSFVLSDNEPALADEAGAVEGRQAVYLRDEHTGAYRLLFQAHVGEVASFFLVAVTPAAGADGGEAVGVGADVRVFFESSDPLIEGVAVGVRNLYEWDGGVLGLVDCLPGGAPADGGAAGGFGPGAVEETVELPDHSFGWVSYFVHDAVSEDGTRVFFTDLGSGRLYVRELRSSGVAETVPVSGGPAVWLAGTPDGAHAFYSEAGVLYRFDVEASHAVALTPAGGEVQGVLGVSGDGSYVYFAATGVLASGGVPGAGNVYVSHEGALSLVTSKGEADDWSAHTLLYDTAVRGGPGEGTPSARVSADGHSLMFSSRLNVTGYDNHGAGAGCSEDDVPAPCDELYVYDATGGGLACVSCNPAGTPATHDALLYRLENDGSVPPPSLYPWVLPRNLSSDGSRVFFETEEALLPGDSNSQMDVYEWERAGAGSCPTDGSDCLYLVSSGASSEPSYFAAASATTGDVFFFTRQSLVGQDEDELVDLYDARELGGIAAQNPPAPPAPCGGEACHPAPPAVPGIGLPVSQVFSGPGDLAPPVTTVARPKPHKKAPAHHKAKKKRKRGAKKARAKQGRETRARRNIEHLDGRHR